MLLRAGCYLSFGAAMFRQKSHAAESLRTTPLDRLFLETDDAAISIEAVYERAAMILGIGVRELDGIVLGNFMRF